MDLATSLMDRTTDRPTDRQRPTETARVRRITSHLKYAIRILSLCLKIRNHAIAHAKHVSTGVSGQGILKSRPEMDTIVQMQQPDHRTTRHAMRCPRTRHHGPHEQVLDCLNDCDALGEMPCGCVRSRRASAAGEAACQRVFSLAFRLRAPSAHMHCPSD